MTHDIIIILQFHQKWIEESWSWLVSIGLKEVRIKMNCNVHWLHYYSMKKNLYRAMKIILKRILQIENTSECKIPHTLVSQALTFESSQHPIGIHVKVRTCWRQTCTLCESLHRHSFQISFRNSGKWQLYLGVEERIFFDCIVGEM